MAFNLMDESYCVDTHLYEEKERAVVAHLPPDDSRGFIFDPPASLLITDYLWNKIIGNRMPLKDAVREIVLSKNLEPDPGHIPLELFNMGENRDSAFFFIFKEVDNFGPERYRPALTGQWLEQGSEPVKLIVVQEHLGTATTMTFEFYDPNPFPDQPTPLFSLVEYQINMEIIPPCLRTVYVQAMASKLKLVKITHHGTNLQEMKVGKVEPRVLRHGNGIIDISGGPIGGLSLFGCGEAMGGADDGERTPKRAKV